MFEIQNGPLSLIGRIQMRGPCPLRACLVGSLLLISASAAQAGSLSQMLYDVYDNNPEIRAEEAGLEGQRALTDKARSAFMPKVTANASHNYKREHQKSGARGRTRTSQYGVTASQRLFNGFRSHNDLLKAKYQERSSVYSVRNRERLILLEAVSAYMDVYAARKMIKLRRQHVANLEKKRRATRSRIRAGQLTRTDLSKTEALLARARASLEGARADLGSAIGQFEALAGYQPDNLSYPQLPKAYIPKSVQEAQRKALSMQPDLRAARAQSKAASHAVKSASGSFLPTLDLTGSHSRNFASSADESTKAENTIGLRLSLPVFDGGARSADVRKAKADHSQAKYRANALYARVKAEARQRYLKYKATQASVRQARAEVRSAKSVLRGIRIEEQAGQRSYLDILDAEVALLDAQELQIYARADQVSSVYALLASTGQLTVSGARKAQAKGTHRPLSRSSGHLAPRKVKRQSAKAVGKRDARDPWSGLR